MSGVLVCVEITEVMLRSVLSSIGQMRKNNLCLSESSCCRLHTIADQPLKEYIQTMKSVCTVAPSTADELVLFCRFQVYSQIQQPAEPLVCQTHRLPLDTDVAGNG